MSQAKNKEGPNEVEILLRVVAHAVDNLPIVARLEFAANLVFDNGGQPDDMGRVPALVVAHKVISDVVRVLEASPDAAQLRTPKPLGASKPLERPEP